MPDDKTLTAEDLANIRPVDAPVMYASQFRVAISSTDAVIMLQRAHPVLIGNEYSDAAKVTATGVIHMSLHALKDLSLLLQDTVKSVEKEYGPIVTDFSRQREKKP